MTVFDREPPPADEELTIRGDIETSSIPELLRSLLSSGETGILTVRNGEDAKTIYIDRGRIVYAASNDPDERLGETLLVRGKLTVRQFLEASRLIRPDTRLGAILIELNAIAPEELMPAVEHQVREILMDLFTWTRGDYELVIRELDPDALVLQGMSMENLILDGIRRTRAWSQVMRAMGQIGTVFVPTGNTDVLYKLELTTEEQEILDHVNGRSTVEHICDVSYLSNFETCRILWALQVLGVIRKGLAEDATALGEDDAARERDLDIEEVVETFNQMFSRIYHFLKGRLADKADAFMDLCLEDVSRQYGTLFAGVDLKHYGRADYEQMLANVADLPAEQRRSVMVAALNELVFVIQLSVRTRHGAEEEAVVSGIIKDGFRRLGPRA